MNKNYSLLEILPNEIFIEIFQYFDARDLYRAFYNLNSRFNTLLQSLNNLCLTVGTIESNDFKIFASHVYALKLTGDVNINLNDFTNLHGLHLSTVLKQLETDTYPYLEYLTIVCTNRNIWLYFPVLCQKIFSNGFPNLKSCSLSESALIFKEPYFNQTSELRSLYVGEINLTSYQIILFECPKLEYFLFELHFSRGEGLLTNLYSKLKKLVIMYTHFDLCPDDDNIGDYLLCVPDLKELVIYNVSHCNYIEHYLDYKWVTLYVNRYLPSLEYFKFNFWLVDADESFRDDNKNILNQIEENFKQLHNDRYRSVLSIDIS
jgi:hypothetical protein